MIKLQYRARWVLPAAALAGLALAPGCTDFKNRLLEPQNPGLIDPSAVSTPAAAMALKVGAIGRLAFVVNCGGNNECLWEEAGSLTDEFHNADFQTVRQDVDQRQIDGDGLVPWASVTQNRGFIRDAITKVQEFLPDSTADLAELYLGLGFTELSLGENYCNGIPLGHTDDGVVTYGEPLTNAQVLDSALTHVDSALLINTGTSSSAVFVRQASLVAKARILVDQGNFAAAAALVPSSAVPNTFQYLFSTSPSKNSNDLGIWVINNSSARLTVSDSFDIVNGSPVVAANSLPFASANDPRVPVANGDDIGVGPEDGTTPMFVQQLYGRDDPIAMVAGLDARLIEAEAKLNESPVNIAGMMAILNALRASPPPIGEYQPAAMPALAAPATPAAAVKLFFREKGFWTFARGQRLNDMRRQMRQYGLAEDQVFPTGAYFKGGTYGNSIQFPVPNSERTNPNFTECIDRNP